MVVIVCYRNSEPGSVFNDDVKRLDLYGDNIEVNLPFLSWLF